MALAVLDGNQSATTLSSVVTGGEHIVAHSVVSLGSNAIANITSAVSGSVVSISNFPASTTVTGQVELGPTSLDALESITVTMGQVTVTGGLTDAQLRASAVTASISNFPATQTISGTVTVGNSVAIGSLPAISGTVTANLGTTGAFGGSLQGYNGTNTYLNVGIQNLGGTNLNGASSLPVSGTVTIGNSVTIGSLPAISGTVTVGGFSTVSVGGSIGGLVMSGRRAGGAENIVLDSGTGLLQAIPQVPNGLGGYGNITDALPLPVKGTVTIGSLPAISGTVTVGNTVTIAGTVTVGNSVTVSSLPASTVTVSSLPAISGTVTANVGGALADAIESVGDVSNVSNKVAVQLYDDGGSAVGVPNNPLPISGTVTAAAPNGTLTTRFGTPTTASSVFATSAVTNASRKYLLIQNVTTQSNVITVGIGFTPTTTQGIQLTAGAGITFESSYIPTGAVYVLSSVTASNFTILEA